jgi:hypothetical protein
MNHNHKDPHLQAPQEANTDKHISFREVEESDNAAENSSGETFRDDDSPTRKQWEEMRKELKEDDSLKGSI